MREHRLIMTLEVLAHPVLFDLCFAANGRLNSVTDRFGELPAPARRLMLGEGEEAFVNQLGLVRELIRLAVPLWRRGLSVPGALAAEHIPVVSAPSYVTEEDKWANLIDRTFTDHAVHWYHLAHVLGRILKQLGRRDPDWYEITFLLQAGGPFLEPVVTVLLPHIREDSLRARMLNALLFFPTDSARETVARYLPDTMYTDAIGIFSLVRTLASFSFPLARAYRESFPVFARHNDPAAVLYAGLQPPDEPFLRAAWRELRDGDYTNQAAVHYLLQHPEVPVAELVEACAGRPDWLELLGRFRTEFLAAGYRGKLVPTLDEFVLANLQRNRWPTGETDHRRIEPEIRHALYGATLQPETLRAIERQLLAADDFRRTNAALHLAAYLQLPRLLTYRRSSGRRRTYFAEQPPRRPPLPEPTVAALLTATLTDRRITTYNFAGRAVAQLTVDPTHGDAVTDYLLRRACLAEDDAEYTFCCYLLLPYYFMNKRYKDIRALQPEAIERLAAPDRAAFGRVLLPLHDSSLSQQFLRLIAPGQADQVYTMFEELAQSVNLLHDEHHGLPLAVFHPKFRELGARAGSE